jgi:hypothetical protein
MILLYRTYAFYEMSGGLSLLLPAAFLAKVRPMMRLIRSLGRLSVRGYLIVAGFLVIAVLATYTNLQSQRQIAAEQAKQQAAEQAQADNLNLDAASSAPAESPSAATPKTLSDSASSSLAAPLPDQSSTIAKSRVAGGKLIFSPANITLSLSGKLPLVTVAAPNGARITSPIVIGGGDGIGLTPTKSTTAPAVSWQLKLAGKPAVGLYRINLSASSTSGTVTTEYTGTLTVLVIL